MSSGQQFWIARDYSKCSGCRRCEIACSFFHEKKIWPETSRIRVFMLIPGAEVPHFCVQCHDYPCVDACPEDALSVSKKTGAVLVDQEKCNACGLCIEACPGRVPYIHPTEKYALICDLCGGTPQCVKVCTEVQFDALWIVKKFETYSHKLYARTPEEVTRDLVINLYGEKSKELI